MQVTGQIASVWGAYSRKLEAEPVRTKALTSFLGFMVGDFLAQRIGGEPFDPVRYLFSAASCSYICSYVLRVCTRRNWRLAD